MFNIYLQKVVGGQSLDSDEAYHAARLILHDNISSAKTAAFLAALRTRKETSSELTGFATALYEDAIKIDTDLSLTDTCGTGGDGLSTFNISTTAALIVASCGVTVAKHGNRAVSGKVGSADVLEALGVRIDLKPAEALNLLEKTGISFLFAPYYHPVFKKISSLRQDIGVASIFNFLGPLLNPCKLSYQLMGTFDPEMQEALALTLISLGRKNVMLVHAEDGMDEISPICKSRICQVKNQQADISYFDPSLLDIKPFPLQLIKGGDKKQNARIISDILDGKKGPCRDTAALNAAATLLTAGRVKDMQEGLETALEAIDSGKVKSKLKAMVSCSRDGVMVC